MKILADIGWTAFLWLLWGGSIVAMFVGIGLLAAPQAVERLNRFLATWIDTGKVQESFDRPRWVDRHVYKNHRIAGPFLFFGSLFVLYRFLLAPMKPMLARLLVHDTWGLYDAMAAFFSIVAVVGTLIGAIITFRPSMLREIEQAANQWISTDGVQRFFNRPYYFVDAHAFAWRRPIGIGLIIAGAYVALLLGKVLFGGHA